MIAKVLGAGGGWSGKVEYLYEGKLEEHQVKDKLAEVILHSDNVRVPYEYSDKVGRQRMKADFIAQAQSHKWASKKDKTIGEHVLSFTAEDMRVLGNKSGMRQVAGEYVKMLGLDKTQHVAILHKDTDNPHLHIVFNRVTDDGKKYKDSHERRRALAASVALSQKHGLSLVGNLKPAAQDHRTKAMRAGMEDLKALQAERPILSQARNLLHLSKLADKQGLAFEDKGDRITLDSQKYKLSDLDAMFQANRDAATTAKKAAAKKAESPAPAQDVKPQPLRAQEREELFRSLSMGHLAAKAERMGIAVQKGPEHITLNGERHLAKDIEQKVEQNFEQSIEARREQSRQIATNPVSESVGQQDQRTASTKLDTDFNPYSLMRDATSLAGLEKTAAHRRIEFSLETEHVSLDGKKYPLEVVESMLAKNEQRVAKFRSPAAAVEQKPQPNESEIPVKKEIENSVDVNPGREKPLVAEKLPNVEIPTENAPQQTVMPRDSETAAYLEQYSVRSVALETATNMGTLEKLCQQEGAFFAVGEHFSKVGNQSVRNEWMEKVMAENIIRQQSRPIQAAIPEASIRQQAGDPEQIAAQAQVPQQPEESIEEISAQMAERQATLGSKMAELKDAQQQLAVLLAAEAAAERIDQSTQQVEVTALSAVENTVNTSPAQKETLDTKDLPERLTEALDLDHFTYRAKELGIPVEIGEQQITVDGTKYPRQQLEETFAQNNARVLENLRQYGEEDLLSADSMDRFRYKAEQLEWPVSEDEKSVTVNGQAYPKEELETVFAANREEYHDSLRVLEPLLATALSMEDLEACTKMVPRSTPKTTALSMEDLEAQAKSAGAAYQAEEGILADVHINGERYNLETVAEILNGNAQRATQSQTQPQPSAIAADEMVETPPILDYAISRWQLAELAQKTETAYQKHDDRSVSVGGQTLDAATLDARLEENRGRYEQMRYLEIQQSLGEQMAQARSRAELAHLARLQGEKSAFKSDLTLKDKAGEVRHFDGRDVDTILGDNLKNSDTPSHQLLGGAGATMTNLGHVKMIAREFGMRLTEDDHSITTVDRKGNAEAFDKKEVLAMLDVNQAMKIAELRAKYSFLDKVESFKEFEEQAQENKQDYKAVQASDAAQALRTGQETVKAGNAMMKKGGEQLDQADEMVTAGQAVGREGRRIIGEGKQEQGERAISLGYAAVKAGATMAVDAEKAVNEGALTLQIGKTLIRKVEALGKEALQNYEQAPWEKPPVQKTTIAVEAQKPPTAGEKILAALRGEKQEKGPVKGVDTHYIISERTRFIKLPGGEELHRAEMRKIIEENKIDRAKKFDQTHQSLRLLRESTSFGDLMRRAKETETKVDVKGRYVEIQGVGETAKVRMSDLQDMMYLNRTNHKGQEHDHRQTAEPEVGAEGGKQAQAQGRPQQAERMVSMKAGYAKEDKKPYRGNRRREGKKTPDYELKLGKIKLSTDKSKRMKL